MAFETFPAHRLPGPLAGAVNRFLQIDRLEELYQRTRGDRFVRGLLEDLDVEVNVTPADFCRIPVTGAVVAVSNHPFGILDGVMLADCLAGVRPDVRILTNQLLDAIPELAERCIFIDTPGRTPNSRGVKQALIHLRAEALPILIRGADCGFGAGWKRVADSGAAVCEAGRETAGVQRGSAVQQCDGRFRDDGSAVHESGDAGSVYGERAGAGVSGVVPDAAAPRGVGCDS